MDDFTDPRTLGLKLATNTSHRRPQKGRVVTIARTEARYLKTPSSIVRSPTGEEAQAAPRASLVQAGDAYHITGWGGH